MKRESTLQINQDDDTSVQKEVDFANTQAQNHEHWNLFTDQIESQNILTNHKNSRIGKINPRSALKNKSKTDNKSTTVVSSKKANKMFEKLAHQVSCNDRKGE